MDLSIIGDRVRRMREAAGLTQEQLAARVGKHWTAISKIETGTNIPRLQTLRELAAACGAELDIRFAGPAEARQLELVESLSAIADERARLVEHLIQALPHIKPDAYDLLAGTIDQLWRKHVSSTGGAAEGGS